MSQRETDFQIQWTDAYRIRSAIFKGAAGEGHVGAVVGEDTASGTRAISIAARCPSGRCGPALENQPRKCDLIKKQNE